MWRAYKHIHLRKLVHTDRLVVWDSLYIVFLGMFLTVSTFPAQALAFTNDIELSHLQLVFVRDPKLVDSAVVGIEAYPRERTVARLLVSESLTVRSTLADGSIVRVLSTAYSSTVDQTDASPFVAASGRRVGPGIIAANFLPFGTQVRIGQQIYTVWDRLNARYNDKYIVDIWMTTRSEAVRYGARIVEIEIVSLP